MGRMKLFFASLGVGILVTVFLLAGLLFVQALFPETRNSMGMFWVYTFAWPIILVRRFPGLSVTGMLVLSFVLATVLDVIIVTAVTYLIFRATLAKRGRARLEAPPQPPTF